MKKLMVSATILSMICITSCQTFKKDRQEIKKVTHDLIDEAVDGVNDGDKSNLSHLMHN